MDAQLRVLERNPGEPTLVDLRRRVGAYLQLPDHEHVKYGAHVVRCYYDLCINVLPRVTNDFRLRGDGWAIRLFNGNRVTRLLRSDVKGWFRALALERNSVALPPALAERLACDARWQIEPGKGQPASVRVGDERAAP